MYNELYEIWKREFENAALEKLPSDFYSKTVDYLRRLREESRMLDKRTMKAQLLKNEMQNVKRMLRELIQRRYKKLIITVSKGEKISSDFLTPEEEKIFEKFSPFTEAYFSFAKNFLRGNILKISVEREHKTSVLRFLKDVPTIIGADMKTYGPFKAEDVASLPVENAKILVKHGLAEKTDVN
jgi:DNA replication factor GINS